MEKFSLRLHPEQPSEFMPGPLEEPTKVVLSQICVRLGQSSLSTVVFAAQGTQSSTMVHPDSLIIASDAKVKLRQPLASVEVKTPVPHAPATASGDAKSPHPAQRYGLFCVGPSPTRSKS